jgi:hypothetical protein
MKKNIIIFAITLLIVSCTTSTSDTTPPMNPHECTMPVALETIIPGEHNFHWDCEWQAAYNDGDVTLYWNDDSSRVTGLLKNSAY